MGAGLFLAACYRCGWQPTLEACEGMRQVHDGGLSRGISSQPPPL